MPNPRVFCLCHCHCLFATSKCLCNCSHLCVKLPFELESFFHHLWSRFCLKLGCHLLDKGSQCLVLTISCKLPWTVNISNFVSMLWWELGYSLVCFEKLSFYCKKKKTLVVGRKCDFSKSLKSWPRGGNSDPFFIMWSDTSVPRGGGHLLSQQLVSIYVRNIKLHLSVITKILVGAEQSY